jgi:chloride channel protein, CIC family
LKYKHGPVTTPDPTRDRPPGLIVRLRRRLRRIARMRSLYWLRARILVAPGERQRLFLLTALIGVCCGLAAVAFHLLIRLLEMDLIERALAAPGRSWIAWTIFTPVLGGLVCGLLLQYVAPRARGSGIPEVKASFAGRGRELALRDALGKFGIGALQIGTGGSLGREGPTVHICASIASRLGRLAGLAPRQVRRLLPVGAAAGIAAAFNAPIAAVTFTIEEIVGDLDKAVLSGVIVAAAIAAVIERSVLGEHPVFDVEHKYGLEHASSLLVFALLGIAAGVSSILFSEGLLRLRRRFSTLRLLPTWAKPAVGGLVVGLLAVLALEQFGVHGVTGGGYATLEQALNGGLATRAMLALCAMKLVATVFCYSSGGAGGIFAPALFIGGMLGGAMGALDALLLGHPNPAIGSFALVGMGAFFAGSIRAPITSVLIIAEMTGDYALVLPLMIASTLAYGIAHRIRPVPIYDALLEQDGLRLRGAAGLHVLESVRLEQALGASEPIVQFEEGSPAGELLRTRTRQEVYPVVERASGRLVGLVTDEELGVLDAEQGLGHFLNVADVMRPPVSVRRSDDMRTALEAMLEHGLRRLPVVDEQSRVTGFVDEATIARAYLRGHTG